MARLRFKLVNGRLKSEPVGEEKKLRTKPKRKPADKKKSGKRVRTKPRPTTTETAGPAA